MINMGDYRIGKYEVAHLSYCKEMKNNDVCNEMKNNNKKSPIVKVTYDNARTYAKKKGKRLCTKKEWLDAFVYEKNYSNIEKAYIGQGTDAKPVQIDSEYDISDYNVYHMIGNVKEWINDGGKASIIGLSFKTPRLSQLKGILNKAKQPVQKFERLQTDDIGFRLCQSK